MSRSSSNKQKRYIIEKRLLIYGEGLREEQFLKYLKSLYSRNRNVFVTIRKGAGGSPEQLIIQTGRIPGDYKKRIVLIDNDKGRREMEKALTKAKKLHIEILIQTPCLEAFLLSILNNGQKYTKKTSSWCKKVFESYFDKKNNQVEVEDFVKIFNKSLLDKKRKTIPELNKILLLLEGF